MNKTSKIYVAGHNGMVGSAIKRLLLKKGYENLVYTPFPPYDLTDQKIVADFFSKEKPEYVILAAAKVGGIEANNKYRGDFIYNNLMIQSNFIHQSYLNGVKKLLFLGSSCIYPKDAQQPIREDYLLTDILEYTNEPYAIAKIAGIKMCESYNIQFGTNFISVMPTNLYGPNDNYNLETSHVLPALIRKIHLAKCLERNDWESIKSDIAKHPIEGINGNSDKDEILDVLRKYGITVASIQEPDTQLSINIEKTSVTINLWGTGSPYREFLFVDDLAEACVFLMENIDFRHLIPNGTQDIKNTHINIGTGQDLRIKDLANLIKKIIGFKGEIKWDLTKPDGTFRKLLDVTKMHSLGWKEKISLEDGIQMIYREYIS